MTCAESCTLSSRGQDSPLHRGPLDPKPQAAFQLNPEPKLYWNYGDSVMQVYEPYCDGVFECWSTKQLEAFVNALTDTRARPAAAR